jgi:hypothetical protein
VNIRFSSYALFRMEQRNISRLEVEATVARPEISGPAKEGRQASWARVEGRSIMVIHEPAEDGSATLVVTVYPRRRRPQL